MMTPEFFERQYPDVRTFLAIKQAMDPQELFQSDLYRRVLEPLA
jgi:FAD/FMN-containing dehydrogenase